MLTIQNASDVVKFLDIVNVFMSVQDSHKAELEAYLDKIDELQAELDDTRATNRHLSEQKKEHQQTIAHLREELRLTIEKNDTLERAVGELQDKIETLR